MLKKIVLVVAMTCLPITTFAYSNIGCAKKEANLERQLRYAEQYGNQYRITNLKIALDNVRINCGKNGQYDSRYDQDYYTDENYAHNLEKKINKHREKVREAEYELEKAKIKGKFQKIADKERKLKERQAELDSYLRTRDALAK